MKKITRLLLMFLITSSAFSQELYDINTIQTIDIVFEESNWDELLDIEKAADNNYTEATSVTINGTIFLSVGVKYKGNSSYRANQTKNPFHIELDTYVDQNYQGYTDIKLANVFSDPSFVRETVAFNIANQYMDAPQANYANVSVNGSLIGLYTNTESISKKFVNKHFYSKDNAFFNCSPPAGAGPTSTNLPSLEYLGTDYTSYEDAYEIKSDDDEDATVAEAHWNDLIELTNILNNDISNIENVIDVDKVIWMLALDNVLVNLDSYIGKFKQNYYLYKNDNNKFKAVMWDLNMSFGTFGQTGEANSGGPGGGGPGGGAGLTTAEKSQLDHLLHINDDSFPLFSKLMAVPEYKRMYLAHYKTILTENISNSRYLTLSNDYQAIITTAVTEDTNKFYTDAQFTGNINNDYNAGNNTAPSLTDLMSERNTYLLAQSDFTNTQPTISNIIPSEATPTIGDLISIAANITNNNSNSVYLGYRTDETLSFTKVLMFDDGAHNDGASGDNVYGIDITIDSDYMQYFIYAENDNIGAFSPARAAYEFYTLNATYPTLNEGDVVINEILASNDSGSTDEEGEFEDWVELYNTTDTPLSLDNLYLSDDIDDRLIYQFPAGTILAADSYLIVWCDKDEEQGDFHAGFKLSAGGESVILSYSDGTILQEINFDEQTTDMSYARTPNGTGDFVITTPTFGLNNETTLSVDSLEPYLKIRFYPNPIQTSLTVESSEILIKSLKVSSLLGQVFFNKETINQTKTEIDFSNFSKGIYFVTINNSEVVKVIKQ